MSGPVPPPAGWTEHDQRTPRNAYLRHWSAPNPYGGLLRVQQTDRSRFRLVSLDEHGRARWTVPNLGKRRAFDLGETVLRRYHDTYRVRHGETP